MSSYPFWKCLKAIRLSEEGPKQMKFDDWLGN